MPPETSVRSTQPEGEYRRDNYWGKTEADERPERDPGDYGVGDGPESNPGPAGTWHPDPNERHKIVARWVLRGDATMLCRTTLLDDPDRGFQNHLDAEGIESAPNHDPLAMHTERQEVELTDPEVRPPTETAKEQRHRCRLNTEMGYISGVGRSTAVWIQDREKEKFLDCIREWLATCHSDLRGYKHKQTIDFAKRHKCRGEKRDVEIMEFVVQKVAEDRFDPPQ